MWHWINISCFFHLPPFEIHESHGINKWIWHRYQPMIWEEGLVFFVPLISRRKRLDGVDWPWRFKSCKLSFAGNRAAEERRAKVGQKVQMDEHEGGVRSPVLSLLAQSVRQAGSRQGQSLPVRGLRRRNILSTHKHLFAF